MRARVAFQALELTRKSCLRSGPICAVPANLRTRFSVADKDFYSLAWGLALFVLMHAHMNTQTSLAAAAYPFPSHNVPALPCAAADGQLEILSAAELARRALPVPDSFALRFPRHWRSNPVQNRASAWIESETLAWLRTHGIGVEADEAEKLRKFNCAGYGGYSMPQADPEKALLVMQFIALWLFWDDLQVEEELGWDATAVVQALTSAEAPRSQSRYIAAWADLGRRLQRTQSQLWLRQLTTTMQQWLDNAKFETRMARAFQAGHCPDFSTAFDCRTISIGMYPTVHLIEYAEGLEMPFTFHQHPAVRKLKRLASRLVGMGNELGGLAKDLRQRWINLVSILHAQGVPGQRSLAGAFQHLVDIHNADVQEFDQVAAALPSWGKELDAQLGHWVRALRYNVYGFTLWESVAERYQEHKAVLGTLPLVAPVLAAGVSAKVG